MKKKLFQLIIKIAKIVLFYEARFRDKAKQTEAIIQAQKKQSPSQDKISILIPVYNVAPFLKQCLESVLAQTYQNLEIICVDDAATDKSAEILDTFAARDDRIKVIHKAQNEGLPQARKTAFEASRGAWVLNVDSDDWIEPDMVESLYYLAQAGYDAVVCDYVKESPKTSNLVHQPQILEAGDKLERIAKRSFGYGNTIWNRLMKRQVAEQLDFPTVNAGEDIYLNAQLYYFADRIGYYPKGLYHWRVNPESMTNKLTQATFNQLADNYQAIYDFCQKKFGKKAAQILPLYQKRMKKINREP